MNYILQPGMPKLFRSFNIAFFKIIYWHDVVKELQYECGKQDNTVTNFIIVFQKKYANNKCSQKRIS